MTASYLNRAMRSLGRAGVWTVLLLIVVAGIVSGCATSDPDNQSERPWNAPKSWEHGIPPEMMEGR